MSCLFETESQFVDQASLPFTEITCLCPQSTVIKGESHHTQLNKCPCEKRGPALKQGGRDHDSQSCPLTTTYGPCICAVTLIHTSFTHIIHANMHAQSTHIIEENCAVRPHQNHPSPPIYSLNKNNLWFTFRCIFLLCPDLDIFQ